VLAGHCFKHRIRTTNKTNVSALLEFIFQLVVNILANMELIHKGMAGMQVTPEIIIAMMKEQ
jgi:hypothetical protein